ncbi:DUF928 domain-containing protein [Candidatus Halobeggiatoa sp. HSG11]|nr:DUF928 domain-containing protein [Candidatus Halobeggiatoa sp. HSG11]
MKILKIFFYCSIFIVTLLEINVAAEEPVKMCKLVLEQSDVLQKRRRDAGDIEEVAEKSNQDSTSFSKSRANSLAFKRKVGRANSVAFKRKVGRANSIAFKRKVGRANSIAFKRKVGRANSIAFKRKVGRANSIAFKRKVGRANSIAFKRKVGRGNTPPVAETIKLPTIVAPIAPLRKESLTANKQPTIYWYMSSEWQYNIGFTLNKFGANEPLIEHTFEQKTVCERHLQGDFICHVNLADYDITLQPNQQYEWFVFIIFDSEQRTSDWLASAFIRYQPTLKEEYWHGSIDKIIKNTTDNQIKLGIAEHLQNGCKECYYEIKAE